MKSVSNTAASSQEIVASVVYSSVDGLKSRTEIPDAQPSRSETTYSGNTRTRVDTNPDGSATRSTYLYGFNDTTTGSSIKKLGDLWKVEYSGGAVPTPNVSYTYDRRGRRSTTATTAVTGVDAMTTTYAYSDGVPAGESYVGGVLGGMSVLSAHDTTELRRRASLTMIGDGTRNYFYHYDTSGRLDRVGTTVGDEGGEYSAIYTYRPQSDVVQDVSMRANTTIYLKTTQFRDRLGRIQAVTHVGNNNAYFPFARLDYAYNANNQRTRIDLSGGTYWKHEYDDLGQVRYGRRFWNDSTPVAGQQYEYTFDDIGNRALQQNLWVRMAHPSSRRASPLRVATGGDASCVAQKLVAAARPPAAGMLLTAFGGFVSSR